MQVLIDRTDLEKDDPNKFSRLELDFLPCVGDYFTVLPNTSDQRQREVLRIEHHVYPTGRHFVDIIVGRTPSCR